MNKAILLLSAILPLSGCMTSGTNLHGDFACRAPNGTCAPMSVIDAKAVAEIGVNAQSIGGQDILSIPSGGRTMTVGAGAGQGAVLPGRTGERVLKVVFPAHVDASGIYHDEASAHAVVERPVWTADLTGNAASATLTAAAVSAPRGRALATLDEVVAARAAGVTKQVSESGPPIDKATPAGVIPSAWMSPSRAAAPLNLREAIAGSSAGPVAGLDGAAVDTPDVTAALASLPRSGARSSYKTVRWHGRSVRVAVRQSEVPSVDAEVVEADNRLEPTGSGDSAVVTGVTEDARPVAYRTVRWHGRAYRIPVKRRESIARTASAAPEPAGARELNLAALARQGNGQVAALRMRSGEASALRPPTAAAGYSTRSLAATAVSSPIVPPGTSDGGVAPPVTATNAPAPPAGLAPVFSPTADAALAAKRVRRMAAPVIERGVLTGRAAAEAETADLGNPFTALTAAETLSSKSYGPQLPRDGEPRR